MLAGLHTVKTTMTDEIDKMFSDLDTYYPGSKRKRREPKAPEVEVDDTWESKSYTKTLPNGKDMEFYTIGALAQALGRPVITIRQWIKSGYLPPSPYRLPTKKNVKGEDHKGRRLYSKAQIDSVVELFKVAGVLHVKRIQWPNQQLTNAIAEAWKNIQVEDSKTTETKE